MTKVCLPRQKFCRDKRTFVATKDVFVATTTKDKKTLVAAPANDTYLFSGTEGKPLENELSKMLGPVSQ